MEKRLCEGNLIRYIGDLNVVTELPRFHYSSRIDEIKNYIFLGDYPPTPPKANININFSLRVKCWVRGGVGGQFPRNEK